MMTLANLYSLLRSIRKVIIRYAAHNEAIIAVLIGKVPLLLNWFLWQGVWRFVKCTGSCNNIVIASIMAGHVIFMLSLLGPLLVRIRPRNTRTRHLFFYLLICFISLTVYTCFCLAQSYYVILAILTDCIEWQSDEVVVIQSILLRLGIIFCSLECLSYLIYRIENKNHLKERLGHV